MNAKLAYVTDLPLTPSGGGSYAVSYHAFQQLERHFSGVAAVVDQPKANAIDQFSSQIQRKLFRQPGSFAYFSGRTLDQNAKRIASKLPPGLDAIVLRSATRWCHAKLSCPYFVYLDVAFHTFFHNTFDPSDFSAKDLQRIWDEEAAFLDNAAGVFFESQWGLDRTRETYGLELPQAQALGRGGVLAPPAEDTWDGESLNLVTIAMKFEQKGGDLLLAAFDQLRQQYPGIRWSVIGGEPTGNWRDLPEIHFEGKLRPDDPTECERFRQILANAFLLIHPTREDTNPLVLTEAAYFGCPSISVNRFGIPELVADGETGVLLESPVEPNDLAQAIIDLVESPGRYQTMRRRARENALRCFTWDALGDRMAATINQAIGE